MSRIHILGIGGTFMGGLAALAREMGVDVEGSDQNLYPPMSTQLEQLGIALKTGYRAEHLEPAPDLVVVGNAMSRGNAAVEHVLDARLPYVSGPQWLGETVLPRRRVLAIAGTHGKTTTTSLVAWILEHAGRDPGFLVGGVPENFGVSARLGTGPDFVVEADEYDTAFFDKRSKFLHYRPTVALLNNLEFDHADIFPDVAAIQRQFHHLVRIVPRNGLLVVNGEDAHLAEVLAMGCWSRVERFAIDADAEWRARDVAPDGSAFVVEHAGRIVGRVSWDLLGRHSVMNALGALATAHAAGVAPETALAALALFRAPKRRLERIAELQGVIVMDDFAHHPTAIATTLAGLRARLDASRTPRAGGARILVAFEPRSNTMRLGTHAAELAPAFAAADGVVLLHKPELGWNAGQVTDALGPRGVAVPTVERLLDALVERVQPGDHVVFMSNGGFENAPRRFAERLATHTFR